MLHMKLNCVYSSYEEVAPEDIAMKLGQNSNMNDSFKVCRSDDGVQNS